MKALKGIVSVIMPAYNESSRIQESIAETVRTFQEFGCSWELIVLDDGSGDDTYERARNAAGACPPGTVIVKKNRVNLGKGRALKRAFKYIRGDYVVFLDADMDLHPVQIQTLFDIMRFNDADIVIGSKMHPNSVVRYPLQRKIISRIYFWFVWLFFRLPCHDTQTGLKLFKSQVLRAVFPRLLVKQFAFDLELLVNAHHLGFRLAEAPIELSPQRSSYGRIGMRALWVTFLDTLAVFYRMYILKYYDRIDYHRRKNIPKKFGKMRKGMSGA